MDGYTLTEKMRKARRRFRLTATEQALFHELVAVCNGEGWGDVFDCSNLELCCALGINEKTLVKARESLINANLLYYKSGKSRRSVSSYSFSKPFKTTGRTTVNNTVDTPTDTPTDVTAFTPTVSTDLIKTETKTETKIIPPISPKGYESFDFSFCSSEFEEVFFTWLEYKSGRSDKYKTQKSIELCFKKLITLSDNDVRIAKNIVEQSMANNWAGLFELKDGNKNKANSVNTETPVIRSSAWGGDNG